MCRWDITGKDLMKKRRIIIAIALTMLMQLFVACEVLADPAFHEGFRQGWNSTTPEEYHY